jgi:hypothetical protein
MVCIKTYVIVYKKRIESFVNLMRPIGDFFGKEHFVPLRNRILSSSWYKHNEEKFQQPPKMRVFVVGNPCGENPGAIV